LSCDVGDKFVLDPSRFRYGDISEMVWRSSREEEEREEKDVSSCI
jgi:hypothetical protein